jgi:DNA processing protein
VARGTNNLLKDGATPVSGTEDVLDELFGVGVRRVPEARPASGPSDPVLQAALAAAESNDSVEAVAAVTGLRISQTRAALGRLEVDGYLVRRDLGGWERTAR